MTLLEDETLDDEARTAEWWRDAVIYQVYPRSFADADGDGIGDLAGIRRHLDHIHRLGADAIWITPWYDSPLVDGGYDVADYRRIHPDFGDLAEAEALIADAAALGIRTIIDVVPNHVSSEHRWFREALAAKPGSPERDRFWFRDGSGPDGSTPPNSWPNSFSGGSWTRTSNPDGTPGQWYLHLFDAQQPDLNWDNPEVRAEHEDVLRFWFDRGVAGVRIDSAALVAKDPELTEVTGDHGVGRHPTLDRDEVHDIYRSWRGIADSYADDRVLVGEVWLADHDRFALYLRPDEMHMAFNFDFMVRPWSASAYREAIDETLRSHAGVGAPATWVLSNHDITRPVSRLGRADSAFSFDTKTFGTPTDLATGARRARAAALLAAALPGALYIYQGDELGLPEVEDIPDAQREDPMYHRSGGADPGRDGCRVPIPWTRGGTNSGFSPAGAVAPWLPQPVGWGELSVEAQEADPSSFLHLYRDALALRRSPDGPRGALAWLPTEGDDVIAFRRGARFASITNCGSGPARLPDGAEVLLASGPLDGDLLPGDTGAWLRLPPASWPSHD